MKNKINEIRKYIDKKVVESIKHDNIDSTEFQEVLENIDKMIQEIECTK